MYHSLTFYDSEVPPMLGEATDVVSKNTYDDWFLIPMSRPVINPPEQKKYVIDIPGANGVLDFSNAITGYPVFNNREGEMEFAVENGKRPWQDIYAELMQFFNGRKISMITEEDSDYFYTGRFSITKWDSNNDGTWSTVTISYNVEPYKLFREESTDDWLWDPFDFNTGIIQSDRCSNIVINSQSSIQWIDLTDIIGSKPIIPVIRVSLLTSLAAFLVNTDLKYDNSSSDGKALVNGANNVYDFICCNLTPHNLCKIGFKGKGTVSIDFRRGIF